MNPLHCASRCSALFSFVSRITPRYFTDCAFRSLYPQKTGPVTLAILYFLVETTSSVFSRFTDSPDSLHQSFTVRRADPGCPSSYFNASPFRWEAPVLLHTLNSFHQLSWYDKLQRLPTYHFRGRIAKGTFYIQESTYYIAPFLQLPLYSIYSLMQCRVDGAALFGRSVAHCEVVYLLTPYLGYTSLPGFQGLSK